MRQVERHTCNPGTFKVRGSLESESLRSAWTQFLLNTRVNQSDQGGRFDEEPGSTGNTDKSDKTCGLHQDKNISCILRVWRYLLNFRARVNNSPRIHL